MNKIMVCIICFFGINIISCVSINNKSSGGTAIIKDSDEIIISAERLIDEFLNNEEQAQQKYKNKRVVITGKIYEKAIRGITKWPVDNPPPKDFNFIIFGNYNDIGICVRNRQNNHILTKRKRQPSKQRV